MISTRANNGFSFVNADERSRMIFFANYICVVNYILLQKRIIIIVQRKLMA